MRKVVLLGLLVILVFGAFMIKDGWRGDRALEPVGIAKKEREKKIVSAGVSNFIPAIEDDHDLLSISGQISRTKRHDKEKDSHRSGEQGLMSKNNSDWESDIEDLPPAEKKYADAILRFREALRSITKQDLAQEREELREALKKARAYHMPEPSKEDFVDEYGNKWVKKSFEGGIVRYDFPES